MSILPTSSRLPTLSTSMTLIRRISGSKYFVKRPPPRPKMPKVRSPHDERLPLPSSGAREPHPPNLVDHIPNTSSVSLEGSSLRLHYAPPASAPSFTTGQVPALLKWLGGESVRLTGEEAAPVRSRIKESQGQWSGEWSDGVVGRIAKLRADGKSLSQICKMWVLYGPLAFNSLFADDCRMGIPPEHRMKITYHAELPASQRQSKDDKLAAQQSTWSYKKKLARAIRSRRREFW